MSREIKFRAWDSREKEMVDHENLVNDPDDWLLEILSGDSPDALMQYTGLRDKNGKDIYEGDIVAYGVFALNDTQVYGDSPWSNLPDGIKRDDISTTLSKHLVDFSIPNLNALKQAIEGNPDVRGLEVIGNIHQNPELLEINNEH